MTSAIPTSPPRSAPPPGAWDCHAHIYGPFDRYPLAEDADYPPPLAPLDDYMAMLDRVGMAHGVLVHSVPYGTNNTILLDALSRHPDRLRGIALARPDTPMRELEAMNSAGVRGLRFFHARNAGPAEGRVGLDALAEMAPKLRALGWHAQLFLRVDDFIAAAPDLLRLGVPLVLDHLGGRVLAANGVDDTFQHLLRLLHDEDLWVKLSPHRSSKRAPGHEDVRPFHDALLATRPDRLIWGSDWPFVAMKTVPDAGHLFDLFTAWTPDEALRQRILVDNPRQLYDG